MRPIARDRREAGSRSKIQTRLLQLGLSMARSNNLKVVVAVLLIAAVPVYAQAQSPSVPRVSKGDAEKVATIIRGDKAKTQAYCDIHKLAEQIKGANEKNDSEMV